jgi:hypothetical protein
MHILIILDMEDPFGKTMKNLKVYQLYQYDSTCLKYLTGFVVENDAKIMAGNSWFQFWWSCTDLHSSLCTVCLFLDFLGWLRG